MIARAKVAMEERRFDNGETYTWSEFSTRYKREYAKKEIVAYWETCKVVKASKFSIALKESLAQPVDEHGLALPADNDNSEAASSCIPSRTRGSRAGANTKRTSEPAKLADSTDKHTQWEKMHVQQAKL